MLKIIFIIVNILSFLHLDKIIVILTSENSSHLNNLEDKNHKYQKQ